MHLKMEHVKIKMIKCLEGEVERGKSQKSKENMEYENDIRVRTKKFATRIIKLTVELKVKNVEYSLRDQILRSGTSVGANVREGKASSSKKELIRFYEIALRSANETDY